MTFPLKPHVTEQWVQTKPSASGKRGMVVSQSRDAAEAGIAILDAGGNAIDAAVATAFALATAEPWNSGIGGIGFAMVHRAGQKSAEVVNFGPVASRNLHQEQFPLTGRMTDDLFRWPEVQDDRNIHGPLSAAVPSSVAGYEKLHQTWGRLPLREVMAPAVALAKRGLPVDWFSTLKIAYSAAALAKYPASASVYLRGGLPPLPPYQGAPIFLRQGNLPDTLEHLQRAGLRDFYTGDIAATMVKDIQTVGGVIDATDFANTRALIVPATEVAWRKGRTLQLATGLTAAPTLTQVLNHMRIVEYGARPDAAWFATLARSLMRAYADRLAGLGEADKDAAETCTTHLTVADADGNVVAVTTTLMSSFGSRVVLPNSGVLLNNGVMWFDPRPGQANSIAPGRRPLTNMCPIIMKDGDRPVLAGGASGGRRIMAAVFQLMTFLADFGMDIDTAAHFPRIDVSGADEITADRRLPADVLAALAAAAPTEIVEHGVMPINFACPNVIVLDADGSKRGVSDAVSPWSAALAQ